MRRLILACSGIALLALCILLARQRTTPGPLPPEPAPARPDVPMVTPSADMPARDSATGTIPSAVPPPQAATPGRGMVLHDEADLLQDPEYRAAEFAQVRSLISQDYPGLIDELALTQEEADRLFDLLTGIQLQKRSASVPVVLGQSPEPAAVQVMISERQQIQHRRNEALIALLGQTGFERFVQYEEERPARNQVTALGRTLAAAGHPLDDAQLRPMIAAYAVLQKREREHAQQSAARIQQEAGLDPARLLAAAQAAEQPDQADMERRAEDNRWLLETVAPHLSAAQLATLQATLDQRLSRDRAALRIRNQRREEK